MADIVRLNAFSRLERQGVINSTTEALQKVGGWVEDVQFFSNVSVNLQCAITASAVPLLSVELNRLRIGLGRDETDLLDHAAAKLFADQELAFSLQITFMHKEPDLRRQVPSIPG
ncbi:MAG: hypothetical protein M3R03_09010 [Pseudomonadota bacterium]|nr:hypothetical protein [Pseudomonadota bacterium]